MKLHDGGDSDAAALAKGGTEEPTSDTNAMQATTEQSQESEAERLAREAEEEMRAARRAFWVEKDRASKATAAPREPRAPNTGAAQAQLQSKAASTSASDAHPGSEGGDASPAGAPQHVGGTSIGSAGEIHAEGTASWASAGHDRGADLERAAQTWSAPSLGQKDEDGPKRKRSMFGRMLGLKALVQREVLKRYDRNEINVYSPEHNASFHSMPDSEPRAVTMANMSTKELRELRLREQQSAEMQMLSIPSGRELHMAQTL